MTSWPSLYTPVWLFCRWLYGRSRWTASGRALVMSAKARAPCPPSQTRSRMSSDTHDHEPDLLDILSHNKTSSTRTELRLYSIMFHLEFTPAPISASWSGFFVQPNRVISLTLDALRHFLNIETVWRVYIKAGHQSHPMILCSRYIPPPLTENRTAFSIFISWLNLPTSFLLKYLWMCNCYKDFFQ